MKRIILCGGSCTGKTTLKHALVDTGIKPSVSYTTRAMRHGEIDGVDYKFISEKDFNSLVDLGFFFEYDNIFGDYYGTALEDFMKCGVFILTPVAIKKMKDEHLNDEFIIIQLTSPVKERIKRAYSRGDSPSKILNRLIKDSAIFSNFADYDITLDTHDNSVKELVERIKSL